MGSISKSILGHQTCHLARTFIPTIPVWASCSSCKTLFRNIVGIRRPLKITPCAREYPVSLIFVLLRRQSETFFRIGSVFVSLAISVSVTGCTSIRCNWESVIASIVDFGIVLPFTLSCFLIYLTIILFWFPEKCGSIGNRPVSATWNDVKKEFHSFKVICFFTKSNAFWYWSVQWNWTSFCPTIWSWATLQFSNNRRSSIDHCSNLLRYPLQAFIWYNMSQVGNFVSKHVHFSWFTRNSISCKRFKTLRNFWKGSPKLIPWTLISSKNTHTPGISNRVHAIYHCQIAGATFVPNMRQFTLLLPFVVVIAWSLELSSSIGIRRPAFLMSNVEKNLPLFVVVAKLSFKLGSG